MQERVNSSLGGLASRRDEVKQRCRTVLQSKAGGLLRNSQPNSPRPVIAPATCNLTNQCRSGRLRFALRARMERSDLPQSPYLSNRFTRYTSGGNNDGPGRGPWHWPTGFVPRLELPAWAKTSPDTAAASAWPGGWWPQGHRLRRSSTNGDGSTATWSPSTLGARPQGRR